MRQNIGFKIRRIFGIALIAVGVVCIDYPVGAQQVPAPRIVDLKAADGAVLKGTYFGAGKDGPGVLLLHQCNMQRHAWDGLATQLAASGINVLTFDFRGFGDSGGVAAYELPPLENAKMLNTTWHDDVDLALKYLEAQPGVNRELIGVGGASCGVNQAVHTAMRHPEVQGLMLLSEGTDIEGRNFLRNTHRMRVFGAAADDDDDLGVMEFMNWIADFTYYMDMNHYKTGGHGVVMFETHKELPGKIAEWFAATLRNDLLDMQQLRTEPPGHGEFGFLNLLDQPDGISKATQRLADVRGRDPKTVSFSEVMINRLGYERLSLSEMNNGIEILKLNVTAFPNSPNAYDSLSDAYLFDGQKELALQNAKRALELIPSDTKDSTERRKGIKENAEQKVKQLSAGQQE
jgi:pimeloyl-ACP methyl ester carboxylesterase